jgi:hypothetical protein
MLEGNGFYVSGYGYSGNDQDFFAIWPIGYPLLIAVIAKLSGISIFWSSKILNILLAGFSLLIFRKIFSSSAHIYGLLFLLGSSIVIYSFTWSESLFIFALTGYSAAMAYVIKTHHGWIKHIVLIGLFSLLLFLSRYIGAFSVISTGILGLYYLVKKTDPKKGSALIIAACINALFVIAYLYNNWLITHHITGITRIPAPESSITLLTQLFIAAISELILPVPYLFFVPAFFALIIIQIVCFTFFFRKKIAPAAIQSKQYCPFSLTFFSTGMLYLLCIIVMRWLNYFDDFYFRLLSPGTLLIFTGIIRHTEINSPQRFLQLSKALIFMSCLTISLIPILLMATPKQPTYTETVLKVQQEYAFIKSGSVVAFGNMHLKYLRNDLLIWSPFSLPYNSEAMAFKTIDLENPQRDIPIWSPPLIPYNSTKESWEDFLKRAGKDKNIFLATPTTMDEAIYDKSIIQLIKKYNKNTLIQIQ